MYSSKYIFISFICTYFEYKMSIEIIVNNNFPYYYDMPKPDRRHDMNMNV